MKTKKKKFGFTIVELLTVMAIIALLLSILSPALRMVKKIAKDIGQKAQFHSIDVGLETYAGETEQYPASTIRPSAGGEPNGSGPWTVGAHHLAEALVGRDMLGFDPWTTWNAEDDKDNTDIYASDDPASPKGSSPEQVTKSLDRRKGPYLSPENVEAYQIAQLYEPIPTTVYPGNLDRFGGIVGGESPAPVLTDSYRVKAISLPGGKQVKAGTPILYYRANIASRVFKNSILPAPGGAILDTDAAASIYNSLDNEELLALCTVMDQNIKHHFDKNYLEGTLTGRELFYDMITNPTITTQVRPYNQTGYILMSAGFDGIFGTPDDIYNFSQ